MKVKLHVQLGRKPGRTLTVRGTEAIFGRAHGNAVRIPSSDVSRKHCRLCIEDNKVTIEDLASLNGTFLNAKRVEGVRQVRSGDRLQVGPARFVIEFVAAEEPEPSRPDEPEDFDLIDPGEFEVPLDEEQPPPTRKHETQTQKHKPSSGKAKPERKPADNRPIIDADIGLVPLLEDRKERPPAEEEDATPTPLAGARRRPAEKPKKPAPPVPEKKARPPVKEEDRQTIPLASDNSGDDRETLYVDFDQAWVIPEPNELRNLLQGLEEGETIEEEEEPEKE